MRWSRLAQLTPNRCWALFYALAELSTIEILLCTHSLPTLCQRWGVTLCERSLTARSETWTSLPMSANDLWALQVLARRWPLGGGCLRYALALCRRLRRQQPHLHIGVRPRAGKIEAHAWVQLGAHRFDLEHPAAAATDFLPLLPARRA